MICVVCGEGSCFVLFHFLLWKILWQEKKVNYCSDGIREAGTKVQKKNHPREMCKSGKPYLRVPSKRVAMVSRKVFWGASNPFITGIFPALCEIPHQSLSRRMALKESTKLGEVTGSVMTAGAGGQACRGWGQARKRGGWQQLLPSRGAVARAAVDQHSESASFQA